MKIAIADEQSHIRAALRLLISEKTQHRVVLEIMYADRLLQQLIVTPVDLLIVDWSFLKADAARLFTAIRDTTAVQHIIVVSSDSTVQQLAMDAGADDFLSKSAPPQSVLILLTQLSDTKV